MFNDTRVIPARLFALKDSGGKVELLLERPLDGDAGAGARAREQAAAAGDAAAEPRRADPHASRNAVTCGWSNCPSRALGFFERYGQMPLPPYIRREPDAADITRYQSVFARRHGRGGGAHGQPAFRCRTARRRSTRAACSAPSSRCTWGRALFSRCAPMPSARMSCMPNSSKWMPRPARRSRPRARAARASSPLARPWCARSRAPPAAARSRRYVGDSSLFIVPGFRFRVVDAMVTNFHLPESTLLMLVSAFAGRDAVLARVPARGRRAVPLFQLW